jgi:hypothetical protein
MLSNESLLEVIATPRDTPESIARKFPESPSNKTPKRAVLKEFLFNSNPSWKIKDSMIDIRGNPNSFIPTYYKHIISWLNLKPGKVITRSMYTLGIELGSCVKNNGISTAILRLKISTIVILKYLGGEKVSTTQDLGMRIRLRHGLPVFIPYPLRFLLRNKNTNYIIVILSVLYSYKGLVADHKLPSLSTIVAPRFGRLMTNLSEIQSYMVPNRVAKPGDFMKRIPIPEQQAVWNLNIEMQRLAGDFFRAIGKGKHLNVIPDHLDVPFTLTAGPNASISFIGALQDAYLHISLGEKSPVIRWIKSHPTFTGKSPSLQGVTGFDRIYHHMQFIHKALSDPTYFRNVVARNMTLNDQLIAKKAASLGRTIPPRPPHDPNVMKVKFPRTIVRALGFDPLSTTRRLRMGKLSLKHEAAGKVRVFAIVDYFTQWLLKPIHDSIFKILRRLPTDATFDQQGRVKDFASRGYSYIASFDLKSATDLIPQEIYIIVMRWFFNDDPEGSLTNRWMELLVDRTFELELPYKNTFKPDPVSSEIVLFKDQPQPTHVRFYTRYTRGQPMGALSSWGSLALIHHFLVFMAANRAGVDHFRDYLVLGDDIVIANKEVATSYQGVCNDLGITIGLPKSFVSEEGLFQFASQDVIGQDFVSPISLREVMSIDSKDHRFFRAKGITTLSARVEFVNRLVWKGFVSPKNPLSLVRAIYSPHDWRAIRRYLTKGVLPPLLGPALLLFLTNPSGSLKGAFNISQLMALVKGDLFGVINGRVLKALETTRFLESLYDVFYIEFQRVYVKVQAQIGSTRPSYLFNTPLIDLFSQSTFVSIKRDHERLAEIKDRFDKLLINAYGIIKTRELNVLLYEILDVDSQCNCDYIHEFGQIMTELQSLLSDTSMTKAVAHPTSIRNLRKVKSFVSLRPYWIQGRTMPKLESL